MDYTWLNSILYSILSFFKTTGDAVALLSHKNKLHTAYPIDCGIIGSITVCLYCLQNLEKVFKHRDLQQKLLETKLAQANALLKDANEKHKLERAHVRFMISDSSHV